MESNPDPLSTLEHLRDPQARFSWLVERARKGESLPAAYRQDKFRVTGCQVRTWFVAEIRDGRCWFGLDSDAITLKAVGMLICELATGLVPEQVAEFDTRFLDRLGLLGQFAESRRTTLLRLASMVREFAAGADLESGRNRPQ